MRTFCSFRGFPYDYDVIIMADEANETTTRPVTAGVGGAEMGQSKDGKASDLTSAFEGAENSGNTTGTEGNMSAPDTLRCDTEGEPHEEGICGLRNLGNTCYMNAGLQSLCAVRQFCSAFLEMPLLPSLPENEKKPPRNWFHTELFAHLCTLVRKSWSGKYSALYPKALKLILGEIYSPFSSSRQQDCQEFLAIVLDSLHENEVARLSQAIEQGEEPMETEQQQKEKEEKEDGASTAAEPPISFITDTFQGTLKNEVVCLKCSFVSVKREPFMYLSLPIPHALEEQLVLTWSAPKLNDKPINVLVTILKHQTFGQVKASLLETLQLMVKKEEVVIAEVVRHRINRVLGDDFAVRLRDRKCQLYALHVPKGEAPDDQEGACPAVVVQWHTCVVCLEEKEDVELTVHPKCDGKVCRPCLKEALAHNPVCVVCQDPVDEEKDIVPMTTDSGNKPVSTRLLQANVLFRRRVESGDGLSPQLFGNPAILHFPTPTEGHALYKMAAEVIPQHLRGKPYSLNVTGFMGRYCSRCEFGSKCTGCAIPKGEEDVFTLRPGDYVVVTMDDITNGDAAETDVAVDHVSMKGRRDNRVTLDDCVELFSKEETLGGENPWYCPQCKEECLAKRTLTVQALPKVLMVQLKRFFFQDNFSTKVDTKVHLPLVLEGKCFGDDSTKLMLNSCVCHRGSLSSGHYTSYMCHPNSKKWYFCNDETITEKSPEMIDGEEVYILFYQQQSAADKGVDCDCGADFSWDQEVEKAVVAWLDPPLPSVTYGPHLPRSSSDTQLSSAAEKHPSTRFVDDFGLNVGSMGHTPLTRKSLEDVSDAVVLKSVKVNGVEIYRAAEV